MWNLQSWAVMSTKKNIRRMITNTMMMMVAMVVIMVMILRMCHLAS